MPDGAANTEQRERWNDEEWSTAWPRREQLTNSVTPQLLERIDLRGDERVLDVGSGAGTATIAVARALSSGGSIVGADFSEPLVDYATRAARTAGVDNASFVLADIQTDPLPGPFDLATSQFGIMFFADPVAAFSNIRGSLVEGGRTAFICWQAPPANPWFIGAHLADLLPEPAQPAPGAAPVGPFALADEAVARGLLEAARFADVSAEPVAGNARLDRTLLVDESWARFMGVAEDRMDEAMARLDALAATYEVADGALEMPIAYWVLRARA